MSRTHRLRLASRLVAPSWLALLAIFAPCGAFLLAPRALDAQDRDGRGRRGRDGEDDDGEKEKEKEKDRDGEAKDGEDELDADGKKKRVPRFDVESLVEFRRETAKESGVFEIRYKTPNEKGKLITTKAFVSLDKKSEIYLDRPIRLEDIKPESEVWVLGRPVEREVQNRGGNGGGVGLGGTSGGRDRQIQNAAILLVGESLDVNDDYKDRRDETLKWCKATVEMVEGGVRVNYDGDSYRVAMQSRATILLREKCDPKLVTKAKYVHVQADLASERPDTGRASDESYAAFTAKRLVLVSRGHLSSAYPAIFE